MLSAKLINRIRQEVPPDAEFNLNETEKEFLNAAKFLHDKCELDDDGVINFLRGLYIAVAEEYGA